MDLHINRRMSSLGHVLLQSALWKEGYRLGVIEEESPRRHKPHKDVPVLLQPATDANEKLKATYENLDKVLDKALSRKTLIMREKLRSKLEAATVHQHDLMESLAKSNFDIENNAQTFSLIEEIEQYQKQVLTMERQQQMLTGQVIIHQDTAKEERELLSQYETKLKDLTRENLAISLLCEDLSRLQRPALTPRSVRPTTVALRRTDATTSLRSSLASLREEAHRFSSLQATFFLHEISYERFFQDCVEACKREFLRLQKLPKREKGLQGSLYFRMIKNESEKVIRGRSHSQSQLRSIEDVLYDTVKHMISSVRSDTHKPTLTLSRQELQQLRPIELLGLLITDPSASKTLHERVFPTNVLCLKPETRQKTAEGGLSDAEDAVLTRMRTMSSHKNRRHWGSQ